MESGREDGATRENPKPKPESEAPEAEGRHSITLERPVMNETVGSMRCERRLETNGTSENY
jgi:hypothetical protein